MWLTASSKCFNVVNPVREIVIKSGAQVGVVYIDYNLEGLFVGRAEGCHGINVNL